MYVKLFTLCVCLSFASLSAFHIEYQSSCEGLGVALREDSVQWKAKPRHSDLSGVRNQCFNNIRMVEWDLFSEVTLCGNYALKASADYAVAYNKTHNHAYDVSVAGGRHFYSCDYTFRYTPYFGISVERQHFRNCHTCCDSNADLRSLYRSHWFSPWLGLDADVQLCDQWKARAGVAYHVGWLRANGHARFGTLSVDDFAQWESIHQRGNMYGFDVEAALQYAICCDWLLDLSACFKTRKLFHGHQHSRFEDAGTFSCGDSSSSSSSSSSDDNKTHSKLKNVEWHSFKVALSLAYSF